MRRLSGARVVASATDAPGIADALHASVPRPRRLLEAILKPPKPARVDEALTADGTFSVPGSTAIHTPGHTAGHVSYLLDRAGGILFACSAGVQPVRVSGTSAARRAGQLDRRVIQASMSAHHR